MIRTRVSYYTINDIPDTWMFEFYCNLDQRLNGQRLMIKSIFNPTEKIPSMAIFVGENGKYRFKDFSTGISGDGIALVSFINEKIKGTKRIFRDICDDIIDNYSEYVKKEGEYSLATINAQKSYNVTDYKVRKWNTIDVRFWSSFWIGSEALKHYCVQPLESYFMTRIGDSSDNFEVKNNLTFGYFTKEGTLYKIYQPLSTRKFIKITDHIQGLEQLEYNQDILIIMASLKDGMATLRFKLPFEFIAPHSENTILRAAVIDKFRKDYPVILTLFDNDQAGVDAGTKYKETYNIDPLVVSIENDIADAVRKYNPDIVKPIFERELKKLLDEKEVSYRN